MNLIMMNLNEIKSEKSSSLNSSSRLSSKENKSEFENIMIKKDNIFDKKSSNNNSSLNNIPLKKIEIDTEDKEKLIQNLEEKLGDNYTKEDLVNLVNFYLAINLISNEESLKIDSMEFVNVSDKLVLEESSLEDVFGVLNLNEERLLIPVIKDVSEQSNKTNSVIFKPESDGIKNESNFIGEIKDNLEEFKDFNSSIIENIIKNNKDIFKIDNSNEKSNYIELFNKVESILNFNSKEDDINIDTSIELEDENLNSIDIFTKKIYGIKNIEKELDAENIEFKYINKLNSQTIEDVNKFNSFLINQRSSTIKLSDFNKNDKDMETLMEIIDFDSKSDVNNMLSLDISSFKSNMSDTIKTNIVPESIKQSSIERDISQTIQYMKSNNVNELTLKVKPRELGEIIINLVKNKDMSNVIITVEKEELFTSIKKNLGIINRELKDLGLQINDISIQIKSNNVDSLNFNFMSTHEEDNSKNQNYNKDKKLKKTASQTNDIDTLDTEISKSEIENQINLLA